MKYAILTSAFLRISKSLTKSISGVAFFAFAVSPQSAAAQGNSIKIQNNGADAIRVCMYDARKVSIDPFTCLKIGPLTWEVWDRKQDTFRFHLKVFKDYGSLAALACERKDLSNATGFNINWPCRIVALNMTPAPTPTPTPKPPPSWEAPPAPERDPRIKIVNQMSETVKICVSRRVGIIPDVCATMKPKEYIFWDRKNDSSQVIVGLFKPGLLDMPFCKDIDNAQYFKGIPELVTIDPGCLLTSHSRPPAKPTPVGPPPSGPTPLPGPERKVSIRACNRNTDQSVKFAISYLVDVDQPDADVIVIVEGWFWSEPGKCQDIDMTSRLKESGNPRLRAAGDSAYQFHLYGETGGIINTTWGGERGDPEYCIKKEGDFKYMQGTYRKKRQCLGANHERLRMRPMTNKETIGYVTTFYWNF